MSNNNLVSLVYSFPFSPSTHPAKDTGIY